MRILRPFTRGVSLALIDPLEAKLFASSARIYKGQQLSSKLPNDPQNSNRNALAMMVVAAYGGRLEIFQAAFKYNYCTHATTDPIAQMVNYYETVTHLRHAEIAIGWYDVAVVTDSIQIMKILDPLIDLDNDQICFALKLSTESGALKSTKYLIREMDERGITLVDSSKREVSKQIARRNNFTMIRLLNRRDWLRLGPAFDGLLEGRKKRQQTLAARSETRKIAKFLINRMRRPNLLQLMTATKYGDNAIVKRLRHAANTRNTLNEAVRYAVQHGKITIIRTLLSWVSPADEKSVLAYAIQKAADFNRPKTMRMLRVEYDAPIPGVGATYPERIRAIVAKW